VGNRIGKPLSGNEVGAVATSDSFLKQLERAALLSTYKRKEFKNTVKSLPEEIILNFVNPFLVKWE
jgi:hypothetical protein